MTVLGPGLSFFLLLLVDSIKSIFQALSRTYPDDKADRSKIEKGKSADQSALAHRPRPFGFLSSLLVILLHTALQSRLFNTSHNE
jgi:hypothetical protein